MAQSSRIKVDLVVTNLAQLVTVDPGRGEGPLGILTNSALAAAGGKIVWIGPESQVTKKVVLDPGGEELDGSGRVLLPGLVDCHTHMVFAGSRQHEFEMRAGGATYQQIAAGGGGISSTMRMTRAAEFDELLDSCLARLTRALSFGITTVEIKSGYGLSVERELTLLKVIRAAAQAHPVGVVPTFLGAHVVPPELRATRETYVRQIIDEMLPVVSAEGLAEFCDVFCEEGAFTVEESRRILTAAKEHGLKLRLHAEQLSQGGGAQLAAELGAISADHLEYATDEAILAMKAAGTVAVLLPGAAFYLGQEFPNARRFLDVGVDVALATDFNPGSSPTWNPLLMGTMAVTRMKMLPHEAITALTLGGAKALARQDQMGSITPGKQADLTLFDVGDWRELLYYFGGNPCSVVVKGGVLVHP